ncbi:MAG: helix-turn-helix domain-containing protein [Clostridia bacterium]|nr:helix-turn-helix domain-containing protein [Clostridia bacterium]
MDNLTAFRLRQCRVESHETLEQIGRVADVNKSTVMRWEKGDTSKINLATIHLLAHHFRVSPLWLQGLTDDPTVIETPRDHLTADVIPLPIIGAVRAGCGGLVFEEHTDTEPINAELLRGGDDYFWLRVSGDSMTPVINDRDLVLVRRQESVDSGRYAVVLVDGEEGLVKRVVYSDNWLELQSVNPYYPPRRFEGEQISEVTIIGLVVESKRKYV